LELKYIFLMNNEEIINTYKIAKEKYAKLGVDIENVLGI